LRVETWIYEAVQRLAAEQDQPASEITHELLEIALRRLGFKPDRTARESNPHTPITLPPPRPDAAGRAGVESAR
jgi:hypothetical protein